MLFCFNVLLDENFKLVASVRAADLSEKVVTGGSWCSASKNFHFFISSLRSLCNHVTVFARADKAIYSASADKRATIVRLMLFQLTWALLTVTKYRLVDFLDEWRPAQSESTWATNLKFDVPTFEKEYLRPYDRVPTRYLNTLQCSISSQTVELCVCLASVRTLNGKFGLVHTAKYNKSPTLELYFAWSVLKCSLSSPRPALKSAFAGSGVQTAFVPCRLRRIMSSVAYNSWRKLISSGCWETAYPMNEVSNPNKLTPKIDWSCELKWVVKTG